MCDRPKSSVGSSEDYPLANTTLRLYTCGRMFAPSFASFPPFQREEGKKDKQEGNREGEREGSCYCSNLPPRPFFRRPPFFRSSPAPLAPFSGLFPTNCTLAKPVFQPAVGETFCGWLGCCSPLRRARRPPPLRDCLFSPESPLARWPPKEELDAALPQLLPAPLPFKRLRHVMVEPLFV